MSKRKDIELIKELIDGLSNWRLYDCSYNNIDCKDCILANNSDDKDYCEILSDICSLLHDYLNNEVNDEIK